MNEIRERRDSNRLEEDFSNKTTNQSVLGVSCCSGAEESASSRNAGKGSLVPRGQSV